MGALVRFIKRIVREDAGQDMIEYALLLGFLSVGAIAVLFAAGTAISSIWTSIAGMLNAAAAAL